MALGQVEYALGHFQEAQRALAESVRECADLNEYERMVDALTWQGLAESALGDLAAADQHLHEALRLAQQGSLLRCQLGALFGLAEWWARVDQTERALEVALYVSQHPAGERGMRDRATALTAELSARLTAPQIEAIQEQVTTRSLDEIIGEVLSERN